MRRCDVDNDDEYSGTIFLLLSLKLVMKVEDSLVICVAALDIDINSSRGEADCCGRCGCCRRGLCYCSNCFRQYN